MADAPQPPDLDRYLARPGDAEQELLRLRSRDEPRVIFDIGACEGEDSIRYARRFPRARVFAFEPLPANQTLIRANFARYGVSTAELVLFALSDRTGEAVFHVSSGRPREEFAGRDWNYGNKSSSLLPPAGPDPMFGWIEFKEAITVRTTTLDAFCRERGIDAIDLIHLDVQGAEHLVLTGAAATLPRVAAVWLEVANQAVYQGQKLRPEIERLLEAAGFQLVFTVDRGAEGDQFHVNRRAAGARRYLARRRIASWFDRARSALARLRQA